MCKIHDGIPWTIVVINDGVLWTVVVIMLSLKVLTVKVKKCFSHKRLQSALSN